MKITLNKKEEKELMASVERGEWKPVENSKKELTRLQEAAWQTLKKSPRN